MRKIVGDNLTWIRKEKGLTQEQVAEGSGFSQQYLSSLERGQYNPTIITIYELSLALETTYFSLILPEDTRGR